MQKKTEKPKLTVEQRRQVDAFVSSPRYKHIKTTKELAIKYNRCQEQIDGKCMYPHCGCLFGENGPIDPITGIEKGC